MYRVSGRDALLTTELVFLPPSLLSSGVLTQSRGEPVTLDITLKETKENIKFRGDHHESGSKRFISGWRDAHPASAI